MSARDIINAALTDAEGNPLVKCHCCSDKYLQDDMATAEDFRTADLVEYQRHYRGPVCNGCADDLAICTCGTVYQTEDAAKDSQGDTYCSDDCAEQADQDSKEWQAHINAERSTKFY